MTCHDDEAMDGSRTLLVVDNQREPSRVKMITDSPGQSPSKAARHKAFHRAEG